MNTDDKKEFLEALQDFSEAYQAAMAEVETDQESYWNALTKEDQLKVFCAVVRRIYDGEIVKQRSYRGVLYDIFGFGPEAYATAQSAGYLDIHNSIWDAKEAENQKSSILDQRKNMLAEFCKIHNIEDADKKISEFIANNLNQN